MNHEVYSSKRWMNDIGALCKRLAATWRGGDFAVLEYTRGRYPEPLASQLARRLSLSFQFVTANRRELEDEGIMGPGSSTIPEAIMAALYHWLVMVPRT